MKPNIFHNLINDAIKSNPPRTKALVEALKKEKKDKAAMYFTCMALGLYTNAAENLLRSPEIMNLLIKHNIYVKNSYEFVNDKKEARWKFVGSDVAEKRFAEIGMPEFKVSSKECVEKEELEKRYEKELSAMSNRIVLLSRLRSASLGFIDFAKERQGQSTGGAPRKSV